jgi:O-antigen ligase
MPPPTPPWPAIGSPDRAHVRFAIALLLLVDLLCVTQLAHAPWLLAAAAAAAFVVVLARDLPVLVALVAVGTPLLVPLNEALRNEEPVILGLRGALLLAMVWILFARVPRPARLIFRILSDPATGLAVALLAVLAVSSIETASPAYARLKILVYLTTNLVVFLAGFLLASSEVHGGPEARERRLDRFGRAVVVLALLLGLAALLNIPLRLYEYRTRLSVFGTSPIWLGRTMGLALLILAGRLLDGSSNRRLLFGMTLVLAAVLLLTGSRGPILGVPLAVAATAAFATRFSTAARFRLAAGLLVAGALALLVMPPELRDRFLRPGTDISYATRMRLVQIVRDALAETPWTGIGTGGFSQLLHLGDIRAYPHNLLAEVLIENGIVGLTAVIAFVGLALARAVRGRADTRGLVLLACTLYALGNAMVSGDVTTNEWVWLFGGILAGRAR